MVTHEIGGIAMALVVGAVFVSALSNTANTAGVIQASTDGFAKLLNAVTGARS